MPVLERERAVAVLGSSNLTKAGLTCNHESNVILDDASAVRSLAGSFEEHFLGAHSHMVEAGWLAEYRRRWLKRKAALERDERLRRASTVREKPVSSAPRVIADHRFAFTGKVEGWPRERKLYPTLRRLGGEIASSADRVASADCLVHAEIPGGRVTTNKLKRARRFKMPIITEEQFLRILERDLRRSRQARSRSSARRS